MRRRIILKPTEIYKDYKKNNADILRKQHFGDAVSELKSMGVITAECLKFSEDIEKIYLCEEKMDTIYEWLEDVYGVVPQSSIVKKIKKIMETYVCAGEAAQKYRDSILAQTEDPRKIFDPERIDANMKMLCFLENNTEELYLREASILVYGDSKWFESHNCDEVCAWLRNFAGMSGEEYERNDAVLAHYHIIPAEQEIFIKGDWKIAWEQYVLETDRFPGGIAIASKDVRSIRRITVNASNLLTVENKTSYQRLKNHNMAMMYLGGFASRPQIEFLKKVIRDNPDIMYQHFGDIDIGGFLIHRHLCKKTSAAFGLYCMGVRQLSDERFQGCLKALTENDLARLKGLKEDAAYREVLEYMEKYGVKLEQEIVSYYIGRDAETDPYDCHIYGGCGESS